jgi:ParB-like chromosome segregation protein Spo0J
MSKPAESLLRQRTAQIPDAERRLFRTADDVAARIIQLLDERGMTPDTLAEAVGRPEAYVSRVLGGGVALTQKAVAAFEATLEADILTVSVSRRPAPRRRRAASADRGSRDAYDRPE